MSRPFARIPLRESRNLVIACGLVFAMLLGARMYVSKRFDNKGAMERRHKAEVAELQARGMAQEAAERKRDRTLSEQEKRINEWKAEGRAPAPESYVPVWLYKGLKANLIIAGALLLLSPWLGRRRREGMKLLPAPEKIRVKSWEIALCVALMGMAAWHNAPRLFHSMWGDEEFNASRFMLDYAERNDEGKLEIKERSWITTLWNMRKPTNHLGYSLFARLTHEAFFEKKTGPADPWFSEALLRTPVFIAGLLLVPAFLWTLRVWGLKPWWGLLLLLLHPWFTRFGVDGRGYGFIMLAATFSLGVLGRALQTGRWGWWVLFGLLGFILPWCNMQGIYPVVALNLVAFLCLWSRDLTWDARWVLASRWFVANMITLMLIVGYLAPCLPQLQEFMAKKEIAGTLDWRFWIDGTCAWWFGQPFVPWNEPENPLRYAISLTDPALKYPAATGMFLFAVLIAWGITALIRRPEWRPLLAFTLGGPAVMLLHMAVSHNRPYDWYFTTFVPGLCLMAAAGAQLLLEKVPRRAVGAAIAGLAVSIGLYAVVTARPRTLLRNHPIEASRESVALYRKVTNPRHPDIDKDLLSGALAMFTEGYDPALHRCNNAQDLRELMALADRTGKPLYINVGFLRYLRDKADSGPACVVLEDPTLFEHVQTLPGLLHSTTRDVFRYKRKTQ
ncbi:hypothetical protein AYO49_00375 [Verrucomicrobiaceae bacterium SCGC AG-212-N21]|nr:hypothetical protein AYO49_00375 [Verrucomicrobiaceae bacterium SCGC AG-212-N21]